MSAPERTCTLYSSRPGGYRTVADLLNGKLSHRLLGYTINPSAAYSWAQLVPLLFLHTHFDRLLLHVFGLAWRESVLASRSAEMRRGRSGVIVWSYHVSALDLGCCGNHNVSQHVQLAGTQSTTGKRTLEPLPGNRGGAPSWLRLVGRHCVFCRGG